MALASALLTLLKLLCLPVGFAVLGNLILRAMRTEMPSVHEHLLMGTAVGLLTTEMALFRVQTTQRIVAGCYAVVGVLALGLLSERRSVWKKLRGALQEATILRSALARTLAATIGAAIIVEFLVAMAPPTGSDALHYHFNVPKLVLQLGFRPLSSISHTSLCGQHHLLILFALALGNEQLAMRLIFLGGFSLRLV